MYIPEPIVRLLLSPFVTLLFMSPLVVVVFLLQRQKARRKEESTEPFTNLPLRPPGESLRQRIEILTEKFDEDIFTLAIAAAGGAGMTITARRDEVFIVGGSLLLGILVLGLWIGKRLLPRARELSDSRLGFTGERVVGEELNQLLASGFRVFHDVPFEKYNIDHVLVGPPGVYAVETKAKRKPGDVKGLAKAQIYSDGSRLRFPKNKFEDDWIPQARRQAASLATWLSKATAKPVPVDAILTIPGWAINREKAGDVNVLRPDEIKRSFPNRLRLNAEDVQRIAHVLSERCRLSGEQPPNSNN